MKLRYNLMLVGFLSILVLMTLMMRRVSNEKLEPKDPSKVYGVRHTVHPNPLKQARIVVFVEGQTDTTNIIEWSGGGFIHNVVDVGFWDVKIIGHKFQIKGGGELIVGLDDTFKILRN